MRNTLIANKLVRDKIPEIIKSQGCNCEYIILEDEEFSKAIKDKILEEAKELFKADTKENKIEELADLYEILEAFCKIEGISEEEIKNVRENKNINKGAFKEKKFLTLYERDL